MKIYLFSIMVFSTALLSEDTINQETNIINYEITEIHKNISITCK